MENAAKGRGRDILLMYCDITPELRKCGVRKPQQRRMLLDNGYLKHISAATNTLG
jgi:hypothetical protein